MYLDQRQVEAAPEGIRRVFSENLKKLSQRSKSVAALCREIGINRTQFNRYLAGDAYPRPDVLQRICGHFETDARILTTPLDNLPMASTDRAATYRAGILKGLDTPAPHSVLSDGYYAEWTLSPVRRDHIWYHILKVYSEDGLRKTRVKVARLDQLALPGRTRGQPSIRVDGFLYAQGSGFAQLDSRPGADTLTATSYMPVFAGTQRCFAGVKLWSTSLIPGAAHAVSISVLTQLRPEMRELLRARRTPATMPTEEAPEYVKWIQYEVGRSSFPPTELLVRPEGSTDR